MGTIVPSLIDTGAPQAVATKEKLETGIQMILQGIGEPENIASAFVVPGSMETGYITGAQLIFEASYTSV